MSAMNEIANLEVDTFEILEMVELDEAAMKAWCSCSTSSCCGCSSSSCGSTTSTSCSCGSTSSCA
ncbi:hypothetical protein CYJ25_07755 [Schaalia turicensis]|uniref:Thiazolylpeptide-type bacteriocin n=2 Tax=Actinomycetales TaxID=2037 RepID=A0A2I1I3T4_9ACTO|nr:hypothetical protein CYJ25_07755 [Schaalia turicensis]